MCNNYYLDPHTYMYYLKRQYSNKLQYGYYCRLQTFINLLQYQLLHNLMENICSSHKPIGKLLVNRLATIFLTQMYSFTNKKKKRKRKNISVFKNSRYLISFSFIIYYINIVLNSMFIKTLQKDTVMEFYYIALLTTIWCHLLLICKNTFHNQITYIVALQNNTSYYKTHVSGL